MHYTTWYRHKPVTSCTISSKNLPTLNQSKTVDITTLLEEKKKAYDKVENKVKPYTSIDEVQRQYYNNAVHLKIFKKYIDILDHRRIVVET